MAATVDRAEVLLKDPLFEGKSTWKLEVDGKEVSYKSVKMTSRFGMVRSVAVVDENGKGDFDRPEYREAPGANVIAWGYGRDGKPRFAVLRQPRPHADLPTDGTEEPIHGHAPVVFGQIPMGFREKVLGKDLIEKYESALESAARETSEETGAGVVLNIERPETPLHNPNPTFVATWTSLVFVQVDLEKIEALKYDRKEPIFSAEYITVPELIRRVRLGVDEEGAIYRGATSNSAWFVFFCTHPEFFMTKKKKPRKKIRRRTLERVQR